MNFDIKDIKSWANRHDVKVGDEGYLSYDITTLATKEDAKPTKLDHIYNDKASCFSSIEYSADYPFFLPLNAVKKEKEYRPFKSMAEFTKVVYNLVPDYLNITGVGESFTVRRKCNQHIEKVLITHLEYDENHDLLSINGQSLQSLFENYEVITDDDEIIPFGIEVKENENKKKNEERNTNE